jgi:hypothetical protein
MSYRVGSRFSECLADCIMDTRSLGNDIVPEQPTCIDNNLMFVTRHPGMTSHRVPLLEDTASMDVGQLEDGAWVDGHVNTFVFPKVLAAI